MSHKLNTQNTGLDTDRQVIEMASILLDLGYNVSFTRAMGAINNGESPFEGGQGLRDFERALEIAAEL